jgi:phosphodiesterase/alkaline phosphatase D-like protein
MIIANEAYSGEDRRKDFASLVMLIQTTVKEAVAEAVEAHPLSPDEVHWVRMAIKAEADRAELRKAIIEKTLTSLLWIGIVAAGGWLVDYVASHWK